MLRTPCELAPVFSVTGGGIKPSVDDPSSGFAWIITPYTVGGKQFGDICKKSYYCKKYVGNVFAMVEHMKDLRNKRVHELMVLLSADEDPNQENVHADGTLSMPKRELFDRLPEILTINVTTMSMVATVNVLPAVRSKNVLFMEITQLNLDLLLEEPPAVPAPFTPTIRPENVYWIASRSMVQCKWWDSKKSKKRFKSMQVEFTSCIGGGVQA